MKDFGDLDTLYYFKDPKSPRTGHKEPPTIPIVFNYCLQA